MKIEALETIKSDGVVLDAGDVKTVADEVGKKWCAAGWAKDIAGIVPTGERIVLNARLAVDSVKLATQSTVIGV